MPESVSANGGSAIQQRKTTHFKEILKPSTTQRDIYVKFDVENVDTPLQGYEQPEQIAFATASVTPLVRIGDYLVMSERIKYLSVDVGTSFLPQVTINFDDSDYKFRKVMSSKLDFITVYIGNTRDPYFTKQEYVLSNISAYPDDPIISVTGYLYIPELFQMQTRWFGPDNDADTSWKVIKKLCEECHLGMWTNIDDTNDSQVWIQDNCTTLDFFRTLQEHAYTTSDTRLLMFIDQYDYLNFIDLSKAYTNKEPEWTAQHPYEGNPLPEEMKVILSSRNQAPTGDDKIISPFLIKNWTVNVNYGSNAQSLPHSIQRNEMNLSELPFVVTTGELQSNTELIDHRWYIKPLWTDVHPNYNSIYQEASMVGMHYEQGDTISAEMNFATMLLYPYMYLPVELYLPNDRGNYQESTKPSELQSEKQNLAENSKVVAKREELEKYSEVKDELHSGDYLLKSIRYEFHPDGNHFKCYQFLELCRLPLEEIPEQVII